MSIPYGILFIERPYRSLYFIIWIGFIYYDAIGTNTRTYFKFYHSTDNWKGFDIIYYDSKDASRYTISFASSSSSGFHIKCYKNNNYDSPIWSI